MIERLNNFDVQPLCWRPIIQEERSMKVRKIPFWRSQPFTDLGRRSGLWCEPFKQRLDELRVMSNCRAFLRPVNWLCVATNMQQISLIVHHTAAPVSECVNQCRALKVQLNISTDYFKVQRHVSINLMISEWLQQIHRTHFVDCVFLQLIVIVESQLYLPYLISIDDLY